MSSPSSDPSTDPIHAEIHAQVRAILSQLSGGVPFTDDQDVFATSIVRSMNLLELIVSIEDTYGIEVSQRDVFEGRLRSVQQLAGFIADARAAVPT